MHSALRASLVLSLLGGLGIATPLAAAPILNPLDGKSYVMGGSSGLSISPNSITLGTYRAVNGQLTLLSNQQVNGLEIGLYGIVLDTQFFATYGSSEGSGPSWLWQTGSQLGKFGVAGAKSLRGLPITSGNPGQSGNTGNGGQTGNGPGPAGNSEPTDNEDNGLNLPLPDNVDWQGGGNNPPAGGRDSADNHLPTAPVPDGAHALKLPLSLLVFGAAARWLKRK